MKKTCFRIGWLMIAALIATSAQAQKAPEDRRFRLGISAGFGFPKIPFGQFRTPVSVIGEGSLAFRFSHRWGLRLGGGTLTTFSLGKINSQTGDLKYNLLMATAGPMYRLRGPFGGESFVTGGPGVYRLTQQFGGDEETYGTMGISLGLVQWNYRRTWSSVFEVKWHFLFEPGDNPQVVTATFGVLF